MNLMNNPDLADRLGAAYALGTLRGGARRRLETLARENPAVRANLLAWQERMAALTELQPAQQPSPNVWKRIENLVQAQRQALGVAATGVGVDMSALLQRVQRALGWWRGAALAGGLATLAAVVVGVQLQREVEGGQAQLAEAGNRQQQLSREVAQLRAQPNIEYVAVLGDDKASAQVLVTFDPKQSRLTLKQVGNIQVGQDKSLQLWALPPGAAPRSLGVMGQGPVVRLTAGESQVREVPALAISLEPRGGAPEGSGPTGPVLFKGALLNTQV